MVSRSQIDRRPCPACHAEVVSEIWFILHRHERPKLWQRAATLRLLTCPNGHRGPVHSPLVLFDPGSPLVLYSPRDENDDADTRAVGDDLMSRLCQSLPETQRNVPLRVEMAPADLLHVMLEHPRLNLGDLAPGAPESDEALRICSQMRSGSASPEQLRAWIADARLHPMLRAGIRFELASYLAREGYGRPELIEEALAEWRAVLRLYPREVDPRRWAVATIELAFCYSNRREANRAANLAEALRLIDTALEVLTEDRYPEDFALANSRKANVLLDMGSSDDLVARSLAAFRLVLAVYTRESYPQDWALTLANMATAHLTRGGYSGLDDLRQAIDLMEQVLTVHTRRAAPESWAITQMNLGLALSRLPASDASNPRPRAVDAFRDAYETLRELGKTTRQMAAAYNLGMTLARFGDPATAEEACERLEESLPWITDTGQTELLKDALDLLARSYVTLLRDTLEPARGDRLCARALATFKDATDESAMQAIFQVGVWLLQHSATDAARLDLAGGAFERVFANLHGSQFAELRAAALANFANVLLSQTRVSRELNRVRARDSLDEAVRILRSLPTTPDREEWIGKILMNRTRSGL